MWMEIYMSAASEIWATKWCIHDPLMVEETKNLQIYTTMAFKTTQACACVLESVKSHD